MYFISSHLAYFFFIIIAWSKSFWFCFSFLIHIMYSIVFQKLFTYNLRAKLYFFHGGHNIQSFLKKMLHVLFYTKKVIMCLFRILISIVSKKIGKLLTLSFTQSLLITLTPIKNILFHWGETFIIKFNVLLSYKECLFSMLE